MKMTDIPGSDIVFNDSDGADGNLSEEEQASDELNKPHLQEKKKGGRKYKKMNK
jgi:hypothetical protein